jgi:hypothetical protein
MGTGQRKRTAAIAARRRRPVIPAILRKRLRFSRPLRANPPPRMFLATPSLPRTSPRPPLDRGLHSHCIVCMNQKSEGKGENNMDILVQLLIWINTVVLVAGGVIVFIQVQKITASLNAGNEALSRGNEALSRLEKISLATLERVARDTGSAS